MLTNPGTTPHLEELYIRPAYITGIQSFLDESDHLKALAYWLEEFVSPASLNQPEDIIYAIQRSVSDIDHLINDQINAIIHHRKFQSLEASWRGLWQLVLGAKGIETVKIKVLDACWDDVSRDISRAMEFDQSQIFKKIYSEEYGMPGGEPFGVIIGDYEVGHKSSSQQGYNDTDTLEGLAQISASAFAPFIAAASSSLFGLDDFSTLGQPLDLQGIFSQQEYIQWQSLRTNPNTRFVGLVMPRILMRSPYRKSPGSYKGIFFYEQCNGHDCNNYCWGNAVYAFAAMLIREFDRFRWFGHIRGAPRNKTDVGGLFSPFSHDTFDSDPEDIIRKPATDVLITDNRERELGDLGLIALCQCYDMPFAVFYSNQSLYKSRPANNSETEVSSKLSAMLQHVLCGSRIAHYIKIIVRDKVGSFVTADQCEEHLQKWLSKYTDGREDLDWEQQAKHPLRTAKVNVKDHPGKPGNYNCEIHLCPHYQLDNMISELKLETELARLKGHG